MPKGYPIQTNFTSGELTPSAAGRTDTSKFFNGAKKIENWFVLPQGGISKRQGTCFIVSTKDSSKLSILRRFEYSTIQAYMLEIGEEYIRIMKDEGQVQVASVPVELATPYQEAELRELKFAQSADKLYVTHKNHKPREITRSSDTSWSISEYEFIDGPYLDEDDSDTELRLTSILNRATLSSTAADFAVGDIGKYVPFLYEGTLQLGLITAYTNVNTVTIEPKDNVVDYKTIDPATIVVYAAADGSFPDRLRATKSIWSTETENSYVKIGSTWYLTGSHIAEVEEIPEVEGPPKAPAYSVDCIEVASTPTVLSTSGILTFSGQTITAGLNAAKNTFDNSRDIGRCIRLNILNQQVSGKITSVSTATSASVTLDRSVPINPLEPSSYLNEAKTSKWRFGAWYEGYWPSVVNFHEGRLVFYATDLEPTRFWTSVAGSKSEFSPTDNESQVLDSSGITKELNSSSDTVNRVYWAVSGNTLLIGTRGAEWQLKASSINEAITPNNNTAKVQDNWGSKNISPELIDGSVVFVQRGGKTLRELTYRYEIESFKANNLSYLSDHMFRTYGEIVDIAYQRSPFTRIFCVTTSGQLVCITYEKDQEVVAFYRLILGGSYNSGIAVVEAVETVTSEDEGEVVYFQVKRTINGNTVRYIEYLTPDFLPTSSTDKDNMFFVDCALKYSGSAITTVSGLDHLEGETVVPVVDGSETPEKIVSGGSITLDSAGTNIIVGYRIQSDIETLDIDAGSVNGTSQGKVKSAYGVTLRFKDSVGFKHGPSEEKLSSIVSFRRSDDAMDVSPSFFTGLKQVDFRGDYDLSSKIYIRHDQAYPCTILGIMPKLETSVD